MLHFCVLSDLCFAFERCVSPGMSSTGESGSRRMTSGDGDGNVQDKEDLMDMGTEGTSAAADSENDEHEELPPEEGEK